MATWAEMTAKPRQAGSVMLNSSSAHSARCDLTAASPWPAWICTASGKNAAAALIAGIISVCRTRSRPATYFPASAAPTRLAIMKRSVTLEIASSVSDSCQRQAGSRHGREAFAVEFEDRAAPGRARLHQHREQIGERGREQQQHAGRADQRDGGAEAEHGDGANQRRLHHRERHQTGANEILGQFEQADRNREHHGGKRRRRIQSRQPSQTIGHGRGEAADQVARYYQSTNIGAVVAGVLAQNEVSEPADEEDADNRGEADAKQIDAIIMRREQPREDEYAQQPQQCREDVGGQVDAGLSDQHSAGSPAGSMAGLAGESMTSLSAIAARMV